MKKELETMLNKHQIESEWINIGVLSAVVIGVALLTIDFVLKFGL